MPLGGKNALEGMREAGPYIGLGFQLFAAILLFTGGGYWLDTQLGTLPGLTLVGAAASFAMILYLVLRIAKDADARSGRSQSPPSNEPSSPLRIEEARPGRLGLLPGPRLPLRPQTPDVGERVKPLVRSRRTADGERARTDVREGHEYTGQGS